MTDRQLLERIDVEEFLTELGVRNVRNTYSGEIQYSCPFPGHSTMDNNPSATMSTEARQKPDGDGEYPPTSFYCFTCGAKGTAITFLSEYEGVSPITAKRFLRERFAADYTDSGDPLADIVENILQEKPKNPGPRPIPILDEKLADDMALDWTAANKILRSGTWDEQLDVPIPMMYMLGRGFVPEILEAYKIGFDPISQRISIPARDENGLLIGFKGRAWWDEARPKYLALGGEQYGFEPYEVSRTLWGIHTAKQFRGPLIVIEGELNAMFMHQNFFHRTVGISGRRLSQKQIELVRKYADSVIVYFDDIEDSKEAARKLGYGIDVRIVAEHDKDANESTPEEIHHLTTTATPAILT